MIRLITILIIGLAAGGGCLDCKRDAMPGPPYGTPDDTSTYVEGAYISVTYTYYCYQGQHRDVTYTSLDACSYWETAEYTGTCLSFLKRTEAADESWDCPEDEEW